MGMIAVAHTLALLFALVARLSTGLGMEHRARRVRLRAAPGEDDYNVKDLVDSLTDLVETFKTEKTIAKEQANTREKECKADASDLQESIETKTKAINASTTDLLAVDAEVKESMAAIEALRAKIATKSTELDKLIQEVKAGRVALIESQEESSSSLRLIENVIVNSQEWEGRQQSRLRSTPSLPFSARDAHSNELGHLSTAQSVDSFLQTHVEVGHPSSWQAKRYGRRPILRSRSGHHEDRFEEEQQGEAELLQSDKLDVWNARNAAQKNFDEREKELLELIALTREQLKEFQEDMAEQQPALSEAQTRSMEMNRTLTAAKRLRERDEKLQTRLKKKCDVALSGAKVQAELREGLLIQLRSATKVVESLDTTAFLARDIRSLGVPRTETGMVEGKAGPGIAFVQVGRRQQLVEGLAMGGPFDKVREMIQTLIGNLKDQANDDVNKHTACLENQGQLRARQIDTKNQVDLLSSKILFLNGTLIRLKDDVSYCESELTLLTELQTKRNKEIEDERESAQTLLTDHKDDMEYIDKILIVLEQAGSADESDESREGSRAARFKLAAGYMKEARSKLVQLDGKTNSTFNELEDLIEDVLGALAVEKQARTEQLNTARTSQTGAAADLIRMAQELKIEQKALNDGEEEKAVLDKGCMHVETREDRIARLQEQIDALKKALSVLEGESIPVSTAFVAIITPSPVPDAHSAGAVSGVVAPESIMAAALDEGA